MKMREILFHGKRTDNGEWIEGDVLQTRYHSGHIEYQIMPQIPVSSAVPVLPETIGQFTGLADKNGVRIFEGDICRFKRFNDIHVGEIVFNVTTASFIMWYQLIVGAYGEKATQKMLLPVCDDIEVIGNIHDNTELFENSSL